MRKSWKERGFSLVEVMVGIAIVGTLSAIAIPVMLSQHTVSVEASQKSDLRKVASEIETALTGWKGSPPAQITLSSSADAWSATSTDPNVNASLEGTLTPGTDVDGTIWDDGSYCLVATNDGGSTFMYRSDTLEVREVDAGTACPTLSVGGGAELPDNITADLPSAVTNLAASSETPGQVTASWSLVEGATGYTVKVTGVAPVTVTGENATITGVPGGASTVTVYARNINGTGPGASVDVQVEEPGTLTETAAAGTVVQIASTGAIPPGWLETNGAAVSRLTYATLFAAIGTTYGAGDGSTTFNLPDNRGRVIVGQDVSQTEFNALGEKGGTKTHSLTTANLPSHSHAGATATAGDHSHVGTTGAAGNHSHSGGTYDAGNHNHVQDSHQHGYDRGFYPNNWEWWPGGLCYCGSFQGRVGVSGGWGVGTDWRQPYIYYSGNHNHTIWTNGDGDHAHTVSVGAAGSHSHTVTVGDTGAGQSFTNLQPYLTMRSIIKLTPAKEENDDPSIWEPRMGLVENKMAGVTTHVADAIHTHAIATIENLQSEIDKRSDIAHTHDNLYYAKAVQYTKAEAAALINNKSNKTATKALEDRMTVAEASVTATQGIDILPTGTIMATSRSTNPEGWLIADGSAVSRTTYSQLFASIGTTYGAGDGVSTFNLPNFKGKKTVGVDTSQIEYDTMLESGGAKTTTLTTSQLPSHNHGVNDPGHSHSQYLTLQYMGTDDYNYSVDLADGDAGAPHGLGWYTSHNYTGVSIQNNGGNAAHNELDQYIVLNYMIRAFAPTTAGGDAAMDPTLDAIEGRTNGKMFTYIAPSAAARDAKFGVPADETARLALQNTGARVIRTDTGWTERYYATYNAATNPGGASPAGWYPVAGSVPDARVTRSSTGFNFTNGAWHNISNTAYWTNQKTPTGGISWNGNYTVTIPGEYEVEASVFSNGITHSILCLQKNIAQAGCGGYQSSTTNYGGSGWNVASLTKRITMGAGEYVSLSFYAGGGTSSGYAWMTAGSSSESYFGIRYMGPPRIG